MLVFSARGVGRIFEGPVVAIRLARIHRTHLVGIAAHGDHRLHRLVEEEVHVFGGVARQVDADLSQRPNRQRVDIPGRFAAGTGHAEHPARGRAQNGLGDVAATGVARAQHED